MFSREDPVRPLTCDDTMISEVEREGYSFMPGGSAGRTCAVSDAPAKRAIRGQDVRKTTDELVHLVSLQG